MDTTQTIQNNMRVRTQDKDAFAAYCRDHGMTQADAFAAAVQALELDAQRVATPGRAAEIDEVKKALDLIMSRYTDSIRYAADADSRIRQEYERQLRSKDAVIADLQERVTALTAQAAESAQKAAEAAEALQRAEDRAAAAEATAEAKTALTATLQAQLSDLQALGSMKEQLETLAAALMPQVKKGAKKDA